MSASPLGTCRTLPAAVVPPVLLGLLLAWSDVLRLPLALRLLLWNRGAPHQRPRENVKIDARAAHPALAVWPNGRRPRSDRTPFPADGYGAAAAAVGEAGVESMFAIVGRALLVLAILGTLYWLRPF